MNSFNKTFCLLSLALVCMCTALIHPVDPFDAITDARSLHQAITDSNEVAITALLTARSGEQRVAVAQAYNTEYNRKLVDDFKSKLSGDYEDLMVAMVTPLPEYYAMELDKDRSDKDSKTSFDILTTSSNAVLKAIEPAFNRLGLNRENSVAGTLSRFSEALSPRLVHRAFEGKRNESQEVDIKSAAADAKHIHDACKVMPSERHWIEEKYLEDYFVTYSFKQLNQIMEEYKKQYGYDMVQDIARSGYDYKLLKSILYMLRIIPSVPNYYAKRLRLSMLGPGTNNELLIRIIVGRSEIDLDDIRDAYQQLYGETLVSVIKDDTSGEYQNALVKIVES